MKGSDLVLEKSIFTEYVPTGVYRAHLKTFVFLFDKSQFYYTSSSTITCWISRCVRSPDASSVKRKLTNACTSSWKFSGHSCIRSNKCLGKHNFLRKTSILITCANYEINSTTH